jgi:hypothetical protein
LYTTYGNSLGVSRGLVKGRERSIDRHHAKVTVDGISDSEDIRAQKTSPNRASNPRPALARRPGCSTSDWFDASRV